MTASRSVINPAKSPDCGEEVGEVKKKCPIYVRAFFIGGAGDKKWYLNGPNYNIRPAKEAVDRKVDPDDGKNRYEGYYLGYDEVRGIDDINTYVTANIPDATTHVYIVGHSLGGWNGAHLSRILSDNGYRVKMLITLDPVGKGGVVQFFSDIYPDEPKPKMEYWMNIRALPTKRNFSDTVADIGEQWIIDGNTSPQPDVQYIEDENHANAPQLFYARAQSSAYSTMVQRILETIRSNP